MGQESVTICDRKLWRHFNVCDGIADVRSSSCICDERFKNCDRKIRSQLQNVSDCDGPVIIRHNLRRTVKDCDGLVTILHTFFFWFCLKVNVIHCFSLSVRLQLAKPTLGDNYASHKLTPASSINFRPPAFGCCAFQFRLARDSVRFWAAEIKGFGEVVSVWSR